MTGNVMDKKPVRYRPVTAFGALILLVGLFAIIAGSIMVAVVAGVLGGAMLASGLMTGD